MGSNPTLSAKFDGTPVEAVAAFREVVMKRRFDSCRVSHGPVTQLVEYLTLNQKVVGSSPSRLTKFMTALIVPDGRFYFAQGVEEDYGAQGDSVEEAKRHYLKGLEMTKELHMRYFGETRFKRSPESLLKSLSDVPGVIVWEYSGPVPKAGLGTDF